MIKRLLFLLTAVLLTGAAVSAQTYVPSEDNLRAREEFQRHRLGIFLHWGIYATYAQANGICRLPASTMRPIRLPHSISIP